MDKGILIVDDSSVIRFFMADAIELLGYNNIHHASNGKEALAVLKNEKIKLVLTDINMPEMNGIELIKAIRSDQYLKHLPVIVLTSDALSEEDCERYQGATGWILKQCELSQLKELLNMFLN